jgi:hypothetical protein
MGRISNAWAALMGKTPEAAQKPVVEVLEIEPADRLCMILKDGIRFTDDQTHEIKLKMMDAMSGKGEDKVLLLPGFVARIVVVRQKKSPDQRERGGSEVTWPFGGDTTGDPLRAKWAGRMSERRTFTFMEPSGGVGARVVGKVAMPTKAER